MMHIKELRKSRNMSQQALADVLHVTQQSIHKYEHNLAEPDIDILINLANYFDTTIDYVVGLTDDPSKYSASDTSVLSSRETLIIEYYRRLSPRLQNLLLEFAREDVDPSVWMPKK